MLAGYLQMQTRQDAWQAYTAQMLWHLNKAVYWDLKLEFVQPTWLELINSKSKPRDERTGRQIVDDLVAELRARQEIRKRGRRE